MPWRLGGGLWILLFAFGPLFLLGGLMIVYFFRSVAGLLRVG